MRIWSIHPCLLDRAGLVALWRETLLAQKVLLGQTKGYKNHPQLQRFKNHPEPMKAIGAYLLYVQKESVERGYKFDKTKILFPLEVQEIETITVTTKQIEYEIRHLRQKLLKRDPQYLEKLCTNTPEIHPLFTLVQGEIESWEKIILHY
ncbi:pyrimidine dimer DNA glycosylase/endonuclease V [Actinomycetaceae bacterium TAE3-ERU4]|nr:pyrimidine dimer DNA glycosylase/endonuclease V [Actinomycetaceae bacterium TAE3-ERU4]